MTAQADLLRFDEAQRRYPEPAMIAALRERYPTEPEIDAVLTRKMERRNGPRYEPIGLERLVAGSAALIAARLGYPVRIENARWLSGGASKLQMVFELRWRGPDGDAGRDATDTLVLRMEPAASVTESSRQREFEMLQAVAGTIPVPTPYWVDPAGEFLPYPAMIYSFATGAAKPSADAAKVSGLGQNYGPELREKLMPHFVELLARLHTIDPASQPMLKSFVPAEVGSNASIIRQLNAIRRSWEEDRVEEEPIMEIVYRWLVANAPPLDHVSIVHGDYRSGNFLFDEAAGEITAWLDWEGTVLGDRHQDLTYATLPIFQHIGEDGITVFASGMATAAELYAAYERVSGLPVDPARIRYFSIFNRYLVSMLTLGASTRASMIAGTHQDVLVNFVATMGYMALADLRATFLETVA